MVLSVEIGLLSSGETELLRHATQRMFILNYDLEDIEMKRSISRFPMQCFVRSTVRVKMQLVLRKALRHRKAP